MHIKKFNKKDEARMERLKKYRHDPAVYDTIREHGLPMKELGEKPRGRSFIISNNPLAKEK